MSVIVDSVCKDPDEAFRVDFSDKPQENTYIIHSTLEGLNVTAHGGGIIHSNIGREAFVGLIHFLNGKPDASIKIGESRVVMPHTIIDTIDKWCFV